MGWDFTLRNKDLITVWCLLEKERGTQRITFYSTNKRIGVQLYYVTIMSKESITAGGKMVVCVRPFANSGWQVAVDMTSCGQQLETVANFQLAITSITLSMSWKGFFLWKLIQAVFLKWHSVSNVHHVQFSLFMNSKGCVFSQERSRTKICLICIPGKAWQVTWEKIGSQGKRFQPIRGKERPRGEGNQPIRSILDIRSVFADFLKNVNHIGFMWIIGWKGLNMAGSSVGAML